MTISIRLLTLVCLLTAVSILGCSHSSDSAANFNVRVFAVDGEGKEVELGSLYWGFGSPESPEGTTEILCGTIEDPQTCSYLDIGFEAQGLIWLWAISPVPNLNPDSTCFLDISGRMVIDADPSQQQSVTIVLDEPGGGCFD
jgi:hypothetical protein